MDAVKAFNSNQLHTEIVIKGTDDEPLFRAMNYPFKIKFTIFDENKVVSEQKQISKQYIMDYGLTDIIKSSFNNDDNLKFLDRCEPSISSIDETKQLRLGNYVDWTSHYLHFNQSHSDDNFTIEELIYISNKIKNGLEELLHYEIDEPIIYIRVDEFRDDEL